MVGGEVSDEDSDADAVPDIPRRYQQWTIAHISMDCGSSSRLRRTGRYGRLLNAKFQSGQEKVSVQESVGIRYSISQPDLILFWADTCL